MNEKSTNKLIFAISVAVPVLVTVLFYTPAINLNINVSFLPKLHAIFNSSVAVLLLLGLYFIKSKNIKAHKVTMLGAFSISALFLISYVIYHSASDSTIFGDSNHDGVLDAVEAEAISGIKMVYYFILLTHIILAAAILPFILITVSRALSSRFDKHRKIARITWPLWFYVAVTGVVVYFMIAPYYA